MKKNISINALVSALANLCRKHAGMSFSSKELTDVLKKHVRAPKEVLSDMENMDIVRFSNTRTVSFVVKDDWFTTNNVIKAFAL